MRRPPVHMIKLPQEREITPYPWVHPDEDDSASGCGHIARDFHSSTSAAPPNQAASIESQTIHRIQFLPGQTLRPTTKPRHPRLGSTRPESGRREMMLLWTARLDQQSAIAISEDETGCLTPITRVKRSTASATATRGWQSKAAMEVAENGF
jgi:hypothetical protein